jgi:hypothetical protein
VLKVELLFEFSLYKKKSEYVKCQNLTAYKKNYSKLIRNPTVVIR